ncbi:MAG TPA: glycosyltransferase family 2 protein [Burkholderiales bacterium]|nr:glycosyltransferase family 2 protein [Burkholderiales bacterium]
MPIDDAGLQPARPKVHAPPGRVLEKVSCPPVLVLAFNRPETTRRVLESLRPVRPGAIFFAVDGPRANRQGENEQVAAVRRLIDTVDWDCDVRTLFREKNLGCKTAVSEAITWFFDSIEAGIILEDDCVAHPSFFPFAAELLERYRGDERILMISGDNFQFGLRRSDDSYYFSRYTHIWGWASWRRAWRLYDHRMSRWPELRGQGWLLDLLKDRVAAGYWTRIFDDTFGERNSSWAYRWTFSAWVNDGLTVLPGVNLVSNIGFGGLATHNRNRGNRLAALPSEAMRFPLRHPLDVVRDEHVDEFTQRTIFVPAPWWKRAAKAVMVRLGRG